MAVWPSAAEAGGVTVSVPACAEAAAGRPKTATTTPRMMAPLAPFIRGSHHGAAEVLKEVQGGSQLDGGMGMTALLDAGGPGGATARGRVSNLPFYYFNPLTGEPDPQLFVDDTSFDASRDYGQGAAFAMGPTTVSTRGPVCGTGTGLLGLLDAILCNLAVVLRL